MGDGQSERPPTVDEAIARLEAAIDDLTTALAGGASESGLEAEALRRERDGLAEEVDALRLAASRDAELRSEAAEAVRTALSDLRQLVPGGPRDG